MKKTSPKLKALMMASIQPMDSKAEMAKDKKMGIKQMANESMEKAPKKVVKKKKKVATKGTNKALPWLTK